MTQTRSPKRTGTRVIDATEARLRIDRAESEKSFQGRVVELMQRQGWVVFHQWLALKTRAGYPDLTAFHRHLWAELKTETGKETDDQMTVHALIQDTGGEMYLWRPRDWDLIVEIVMDRSLGAAYITRRDHHA